MRLWRRHRGSGLTAEMWALMLMHPVERHARMLAKVYGGTWEEHSREAYAQLLVHWSQHK